MYTKAKIFKPLAPNFKCKNKKKKTTLVHIIKTSLKNTTNVYDEISEEKILIQKK